MAPAAVIGIVAHDTLETILRSSKEPDEWESLLDEAWRTSKAELEASVGELPITSSAERRTLRRLHRRAVPAIRQLREQAGASAALEPEEDLSAFDDRMKGRADLIITGGDATVIVDYKAGFVRDDMGLRDAYASQLLLYAAMLHDVRDRWPDRLFLLSLRQGLIEVPFDPPTASQHAREALALLDEYNARVPEEQPAAPSPQTCRYCEVAEACTAFWDSVASDWVRADGLGGHAVEGVLASEPELSLNELGAVSIEVHRGTLDVPRLLATGLPSSLVEEATIGSPIRMVNLPEPNPDGVAAVNQWTRVFLTPASPPSASPSG